jgi:putative component of toxin-antitoxin plasmid stabilization module
MVFYGLVQLIFMNILSATIIDSVIDARVKRMELQDDIEKKCFICGISRSIIDHEGEGWHMHILKNHNVFVYLYFMIYINKKDIGDCSSVEKHVKELIKLNDISFFPQGRSMSLENGSKLFTAITDPL